MKCKKCGATLSEKAYFCKKCGYPVSPDDMNFDMNQEESFDDLSFNDVKDGETEPYIDPPWETPVDNNNNGSFNNRRRNQDSTIIKILVGLIVVAVVLIAVLLVKMSSAKKENGTTMTTQEEATREENLQEEMTDDNGLKDDEEWEENTKESTKENTEEATKKDTSLEMTTTEQKVTTAKVEETVIGPIPDPDWKVYTNPDFGFSLKYPAHFVLYNDHDDTNVYTVVAPDGTADIKFFTYEDVGEVSMEERGREMQDAWDGDRQYFQAKEGFYALRSLRDGVYYYEYAHNDVGKGVTGFTFIYDERYHDIYDSYINEIYQSRSWK